MNKRFIAGVGLFILFSTFISQQKSSIDKFKIKEIKIENNKVLKDKEIKKNLSFLHEKNIFFFKKSEIEKILEKNGFIESLKIKKIYPNKLIIEIYEKELLAIMIYDNKKFFLDKKINLVEYRNIPENEKLPIIYGDNKSFKILFDNLKKVNFPTELIKKYLLLETNRWDLIMIDKKIIRLPSVDYNENLENFLKLNSNRNFDKYNVFDYRLVDQLILK